MSALARRIRTQAEWNVDTHIVLTTGPTSAPTRSRISAAALLVNVMARIFDGCTPSWMSCAMRWVSTRVLPEPAPAITRSGPDGCTTASSWSGLSPSANGDGPDDDVPPSSVARAAASSAAVTVSAGWGIDSPNSSSSLMAVPLYGAGVAGPWSSLTTALH